MAISTANPETSPMKHVRFSFGSEGSTESDTGRIEIAVVRIEMPLAN